MNWTCSSRSLSLLSAALALTCGLAAQGLAAEALDLAIWRGLPVYHNGRVMPIDTYSMLVVEKVCESSKGKLFGKGKVELGLVGYVPESERNFEKWKGPYELFPEGQPRTWYASELVLSWLAEPQKWEYVPFISAGHEKLRKLLGVPARDEKDHPLRYVSPRTIAESQALRDYLQSRAAKRRQGAKPDDEQLDTQVQEMLERYLLFRKITFDPQSDMTVGPVPDQRDRSRFVAQLAAAYTLLNPQEDGAEDNTKLTLLWKLMVLQRDFNRLPDEARGMIKVIYQSLEELVGTYRKLAEEAEQTPAGEDLPTAFRSDLEARIVALRTAARELATLARDEEKIIFTSPSAGLGAKESEQLKSLIREIAHKCGQLERLGLEMHLALYEGGAGPYIAPGLNPWALSKKRKAEDDAQPWISATALVAGSRELLDMGNENGYPEPKVFEFRKAWEGLLASYRDRDAPQRGERVLAAEQQVAGTLQALAAALEERRVAVARRVLADDERDPFQIQYTAYPPPAGTAAEITYNAVDPFKWSWILSLAALLGFSLAWGRQRAIAFWAAMAIMAVCILWTAYGFYLRVVITGWAPVTNMYETVVFVPFVVTILGVWFILLPLTWTGIETAWRMTAVPNTPEATPLTDEQRGLLGDGGWFGAGIAFGIARLALAVFVYMVLTTFHYADGNRPILQLIPDLSSTSSLEGALTRITVSVVQFCVLLVSLYILPRVVLTLLASLATIPWTCAQDRERFGAWVDQVYPRLAFGLGTTFFSFAATWLAWYTPVLNENFAPLQPVLRSNFWLTIHVLTIVASYGAGFLALMLGNIALGYYLFGRYREPVIAAIPGQGYGPAKPQAADGQLLLPPRPPEECKVLADYAYRVVQVAVLLLATGTILGGLWADVSWGRFWGWDPKEVWALISLLVYLAILHGRFAGWFNDFGMIFGTVFGATMILMSWYGVNFVLPLLSKGEPVGLHSYGFGSGGQEWVFSFVGLNWLFLGIASARYWVETSRLVPPVVSPVEGLPAAQT